MKLNKIKQLAIKTIKVGKARIVFNANRLDEIKEAITKQDVRDLVSDKAIIIREIKGTRKKVKRKTRRRQGSIKVKVNTRKKDYMTLTRKLRNYLSELRKHGTISQEKFLKLRKEIRAKAFRSKAHLKERIEKGDK